MSVLPLTAGKKRLRWRERQESWRESETYDRERSVILTTEISSAKTIESKL